MISQCGSEESLSFTVCGSCIYIQKFINDLNVFLYFAPFYCNIYLFANVILKKYQNNLDKIVIFLMGSICLVMCFYSLF